MDRPLSLWFHSGSRVFQGERDADLYPPLNDVRAHMHWIVGFVLAWSSAPWCECTSSMTDPSTSACSLEEALRHALDGRHELMQKLLPQGRRSGVLH